MKTLLTILIIMSAALMLTACGSTTPNRKQPERIPSAALTSPCPDLPPAINGRLDTILHNSLERGAMYYECQAKHKLLSDWALQKQEQQQEDD